MFHLRLAALMMPSVPLMRSVTTASFQWFLFLELSPIMRTSPTLGCDVCFPPACQCCSRNLLTYSDVHRFHIASLHLSKNFARFLKSLSGNWCAGNSGKSLGLMCGIEFGVSTGSSLSPLRYVKGRLFNLTSTSSTTSSNSRHQRVPFPIVLQVQNA